MIRFGTRCWTFCCRSNKLVTISDPGADVGNWQEELAAEEASARELAAPAPPEQQQRKRA